MDRKKREAIAVFRYGTIAPVLHAEGKGQAEYFRDLAKKVLEVPFREPRSYAESTFKAWLQRYRRDGFEALMPKPRCDRGISRVISPKLSQHIGQLLAQHPRMPVTHLRGRLVADGYITSRAISERTLSRHIQHAGLRPPSSPPPKARKPFEKPCANDLWTLDFMHGPKVPVDGYRWPQKTYLVAAIDDHSRFLTVASFHLAESFTEVASVLKQAFLRHGLPKILYCDNGAAFSAADLALACARLDVALVHSAPYDAPSRGKIERFFRTVRSAFLATTPLDEITSLDDLNQRFRDWLHAYHRRQHTATDQRPLDRYMASLGRCSRRTVTAQELDRVFYRTLTRKVRNDATVSIRGTLWEVPAEYIGQKIEIRHPDDRPQDLYLFDHDEPIARLHRVDLNANAATQRPLRFALQPEDDDS